MGLRFVVWGVGSRGKALTNTMGISRIVAYIDNDVSKQGLFFEDRPIISLEQYIMQYSDYFIIVTPTYCEKEILGELEENKIVSYFRLRQMPSEFQGYGTLNIDEYMESIIDPDKQYIVYGDSAYSLLIYEIVSEICHGIVKICLGGNNEELHEIIREKFELNEVSEKEASESESKILVTVRTDKYRNVSTIAMEDIFDLSDSISQYYHIGIKKFYRIHEGEQCFIVATGPSLRQEDLNVLKKQNQKSIGVNRVFNIDSESWLPDYYVMTDRIGIEDNWQQISDYEVPFKFLCDCIEKETVNFGKIEKMHVVAGDDYEELPKFSENLEQKVYAHATVTYVAIQLAVYMGFKTIYLIGVDCNYIKGSKSNYFFKDNKEDEKDHKIDKMIDCYISAKEYADKQGINIYNATRGGMLEVFPRVDFDSLF